MDINTAGIKNQLITAYHYAADKAGALAGYTVTSFHYALESVRQDPRLAVVTFAVFNILIFETALLAATVADKVFSRVLGPDAQMNQTSLTLKSVVLLSLTASIVVGLNTALAKGLKSSLKSSTITAISVSVCTTYILFRLWRARMQERQELIASPQAADSIL